MFISGTFGAAYNGLAVGIVDQGFVLQYESMGEDITADNAGDVIQASIFRGVNVSVSFTVKEYDSAAVFSMTWPWATNITDPATWGTMRQVGAEIKAEMAKPLILSSCNWDTARPSSVHSSILVDNPPAAGTITFYRTHLMNGNQVQLNLNSRVRMMPLVLRVYAVPLNFTQGDPSTFTVQECSLGLKFFEST